MKNGLALVVALAGAAALAADNTAEILKLQSQLPACSIRCLAKGAAKFGCQPTDVPCQCLHAEDMTNEVAPCLVDDGCSLANITRTASVVLDMCRSEAAAGNLNMTGADSAEKSGDGTAASGADSPQETDTKDSDDAASIISFSSFGMIGVSAVAIAAVLL